MIARNKVLGLFAAAALVLGVALLLNSHRDTRPDETVGSKVLPALAAGLNDVSEMRITEAGAKPFVTLKRSEDKKTWRVAERDGYPADRARLREFLIKLSNLEVVEVKTSNPASYPQIGVEDVDGATATGKRIDVLGLQAPLGLILGKSAGSGNYVRVAGEAVSYLAKPQITVYNEPKVWLDRSLPKLAEPSAVQEVRVALADGKPAERNYTVTREAREQTDFTVPKLPAGKKLSPGGANANADALSDLSFEDVRKAAADEKWDGASRTEFRLFDGTVITVLGRKEKNPASQDSWDAERHLVRFELAFDPAQHQRFPAKPAAPAKDPAKPGDGTPQIAADQKTPPASDPGEQRKKVQDLNAQLGGWVFELPAYKYNALFRPLDELLAKD